MLAIVTAVIVLLPAFVSASEVAGAPMIQETDAEPTSGAVVPSEPTVGRNLTASYVTAGVVVSIVAVLIITQRRRTNDADPA